MATAQRIARAGPSNSARNPSPVVLTSRPPCRAISWRISASFRSNRSRHRRSPISAARSGDETMSLNITVARTRPVSDPLGKRRFAAPVCECRDQPARHTWGQQSIASGDGPHALEKLAGVGVLDQEPTRTDTQRLEDVLVDVERGEDDDAHTVEPLIVDDPPRGFQAIGA